jgi:hypothetical protein
MCRCLAHSHAQVFAVVDTNSDGRVDYVHKLVKDGINTPNGIALRGGSLFVASYEDTGVEAGLIWRLDDIHEYALTKKVRVSEHTHHQDTLHTHALYA